MAEQKKGSVGWIGFAVGAMTLVRLCSNPSTSHPSYTPPDFRSLADLQQHSEFAKTIELAEALAKAKVVTVPAAEAQGLPSELIALEPAAASEPGFAASLDARAEQPKLLLSNALDPPSFLGGVTVKVHCAAGRFEQTLSVGSMHARQQVALVLGERVFNCIQHPSFEAHSSNRWPATTEAAEDMARKLLMNSEHPPEGALDFVASQFTSTSGRALLLLAARGDGEARRALSSAAPTSRNFLLRALPAIANPSSTFHALLALPELGAPALRLSAEDDSPGREDVFRVAIEHDRKLPREARLSVDRPRLLAVMEARERFDPSPSEPVVRRQRLARETLAEALALFVADESVARALAREIGRLGEEDARPLIEALRAMPRTGASAAAARLAHPTGEERFFAWPALAAALPDLKEAFAIEAGVAPARAEDEAQRRFVQARAEQAELFWSRSTERALADDWDGSLAAARRAIELGHSPEGLGERWLRAARARADVADHAGALRWLDEATVQGVPMPRVRVLRAEIEEPILEGMFARGVAREGPGPEFAAFALDPSQRGLSEGTIRGWSLTSFGEHIGFLPAGQSWGAFDEAERVGPEPEQVLARLEKLELQGVHPANAASIKARAWFAIARTPAIVALIFLTLLGVLMTLLVPSAAGTLFFALGLQRLGIVLGRWGFARNASDVPVVRYARMLVRRAELRPEEARARLEAASQAIEIFGYRRAGKALAGRIALLRGERELAFRLHTQFLGGTEGGWAQQMAQFDLARIALAEERFDDAAAHAAKSRGPDAALLCGAARLAAGSPRVRPLLRASLSRPTRPAALSLLGHALLERNRFRLAGIALALAPKKSPQAIYAQARRAHGMARRAEAAALYSQLAKIRPAHGGARLGQALLASTPTALEELARGESDAAGAARSLLAREDLARGDAGRAVERLKLPRVGAPADLELLGIAEAARGRFEKAHEAFKSAAARAGRRADLSLAAHRAWALAAHALKASRHEEALKILGPKGDPRLVAAARSGAVACVLRREPQLGVDEAARRVQGKGLDSSQPEPLPLSLAHAARALAMGDLEKASRSLLERLREIDDPVARLYLAVAHAAASPEPQGADLAKLSREAVAARASFQAPAAVLVAAAQLAAKRPEAAKLQLASSQLGSATGAAAVHAARLGAQLDIPIPGPLTRAFVEARRGRMLEAGRILDAIDGERCPALLRARAAMAGGAARARVEVADFPGAAAELQSLWTFVGEDEADAALRRARVDVDAARDALAELSLDAFARLATSEPKRALRLLEQARKVPPELAPRVAHDRAVAALGACVQAGASPPQELLGSLGRAFDRLLEHHAALAHFRLRRLELASDGPPPPGDFEAEARGKATEALAGYLGFLVEQGSGEQVRAAIAPWQGGKREGGFVEALRRAADAVHVELRELLEAAKAKLPSLRKLNDAADAWHELDARLAVLLARLRDLGAEPSLMDAAEDATARCLDSLSVHIYNNVGHGALPLQIIERGLSLAHAAHLREHLLSNRRTMGGAA